MLFQGDADCYQQAKKAADGLEHGFLEIGDVQQLALQHTFTVFRYVREEILEQLGITGEDRSSLLDLHPRDVLSTEVMVEGTLTGAVADPSRLGRDGSRYPYPSWTRDLRGFTRTGDAFDAPRRERFHVEVAEGVEVAFKSMGVLGRLDPDQATRSESHFARRCHELLVEGLDKESDLSGKTLTAALLHAHCLALLEATFLLAIDDRVQEAMALVSRQLEWAHVLDRLAAGDESSLAVAGMTSRVDVDADGEPRRQAGSGASIPHAGDMGRLAEWAIANGLGDGLEILRADVLLHSTLAGPRARLNEVLGPRITSRGATNAQQLTAIAASVRIQCRARSSLAAVLGSQAPASVRGACGLAEQLLDELAQDPDESGRSGHGRGE